MRYFLLLTLTALFTFDGVAPVGVAQEADVTHLVEKMTSPEAEWQERLKAEKALLAADPTVEQRITILKALFDAMEQIGAAHGMHPGLGSLKMDAEIMPPKAQISYSIHRTWRHHLKQLPGQETKKLLLQLFAESHTSYGKGIVVRLMAYQFPSEAEEPLAVMLKAKEPSVPRRIIAEVLLVNRATKYAPVIFRMVEERDRSLKEKDQLFRELAAIAQQLTGDQRRRLVRNGFDILVEQKEEAAPQPSLYAYSMAIALGRLTEQSFRPSQTHERYLTDSGFTDAFRADTVSNALAWWQENREKFADQARR